MNKQDIIISGNHWCVYLDKETHKVVCSFNNEEDECDFVDTDGMLGYCTDCKKFFDMRSGCEADIRDDEREKIIRHIDALGHKDVAGEIEEMGK